MTRLFTPSFTQKLTLTPEQKAERYTPAKYIALVKQVFVGEIDLDPASCEEANKIVGAKKYFTKEDDGLNKNWADVETVFLNPPYSQMDLWVDKLIQELDKNDFLQTILLANASTDTKWFHKLCDTSHYCHTLACFVRGRIRFRSPYIVESKKDRPEKPSVFFYLCGVSMNQELFKEVFSQIGHVVEL